MTEMTAQNGTGPTSGDRRSRRSDVSRQQILDVAAKLFRARGYTETSLRDIAKLVGMKAGSLYYHFASKEELAAEVLRIGVKRVHQAVAMAIDTLGQFADARSKLAAAMAAHLETLLDESDYTSAHIRCFPYVPETLRIQLGNDRREYEMIWRTLLDEVADSDSLPFGMDRSAARLIILGALNWSLEWQDPAKGVPSELTRTLLAAFAR
ncbi:TetR/AcrR family transcriptional regulator [Bradyrhizobium genosp. P]|uniref:TetR/AcrR family transcriptional regulator n=1 Tax=Bradyrhizobium genosp. P TaxID=83641 RepID=UPI003CF166C8